MNQQHFRVYVNSVEWSKRGKKGFQQREEAKRVRISLPKPSESVITLQNLSGIIFELEVVLKHAGRQMKQ